MKERLRELTPPRIWVGGRVVRNWGRSIGYRRARWRRPLGTRPPVGLAVCAIFRDEARYLAEWVSFHRVQGVERFYLYDNRSSDDWRSELEPEIAAGIVEPLRWPFVPGQVTAYEDCLQRHRDDARWIAFLDADEFLFSPTGKPLPEILRDFDTHPGVVANWRVYGTSGWTHPAEGLLIETHLWRAGDDHPGSRWVKSIVYPRKAFGWGSAHHFRVQGTPVGEDRRAAPWPLRDPPTAELLRVNHYYAKSEEEFRSKIQRPTADRATIDTPGDDRHPIPGDAVRDEVVLQFVPQLKALLAERAHSRSGGAQLSSAPRRAQ